MKMRPVQLVDRWIICDEAGNTVHDLCPCCERTMLTQRAAEAVIQANRVADALPAHPPDGEP